MTAPLVFVATRRSPLALWQANHVAGLLRATDPDLLVELVHVSTEGDRVRSEPLASFGGTGVFTREVQQVVLDGKAHVAVHSLKDLPTAATDGLALAGVPERGPTADVLVLPRGRRDEGGESEPDPLAALGENARVGTGSPRRRAQLLHRRPDLVVADVRGNVETRVRKLDDGEYDALVLARAGLERLGLGDRIARALEPPLMFHAVGQGALGLECRAEDAETIARLAAISHAETFVAVRAERSLLTALRAGCHAPVGVQATLEGDSLDLTGVVLSNDGTTRIEATERGPAAEAEALGRSVAERLFDRGAEALITG